MKLFDAHCHLQDPRILSKAPQIIETAVTSGVLRFAVNGVSERDWDSVKQMSEKYPSVIPCFGLHPWFIGERSPCWFDSLKQCFESTPSAAVGEAPNLILFFSFSNVERFVWSDFILRVVQVISGKYGSQTCPSFQIGLDKGNLAKHVDFNDQVHTFQQQLKLAKELKRPASVHCVRAFVDLISIMNDVGPFPAGVILHSYLGSAEMVPPFAKLGAYFSFSGFLMSMNKQKAKKMLKMVPPERILLETDAPDALPKSNVDDLFLVEGAESSSDNNLTSLPKESLNHPANIHIVLGYVANLLEMDTEDLAKISYENAIRLFSYKGSKVLSS